MNEFYIISYFYKNTYTKSKKESENRLLLWLNKSVSKK